jgi:hypothetical protein
MKFYIAILLPTLLSGSESWAIGTKRHKQNTVVEERYIRTAKGCNRLEQIYSEKK